MALKYVNILVYEKDVETRPHIINALLVHGYAPKMVEDLRKLPKEVNSKLFKFFICSIDVDDYSLIPILDTFKENPNLRFVQPILHVNRPDEDFLKEMIKKNFHHFIIKPFQAVEFIKRLGKIVGSYNPDLMEKRRHVRIDIPSYIPAKLMLTPPSKRRIMLKVKNISAGGLALDMNDGAFLSSFAPGDLITNCLLIIKDIDLFIDLKVIHANREICRIQFVHLDHYKMDKICEFIYDRLISGHSHADKEEVEK